uniref:Uncharacterized protein n=1 Tax=Meloidogyne enterolobii TaxID=390850 RepID=A0A6V7TR30_MELEN|nr:unnamed protein product [Meloidogyne enterolobii]
MKILLNEFEFFVTFAHGSHRDYQIGQLLQIHSYNELESYEATVKFISLQFDFVLLKSNSTLEEGPELDFSPKFGGSIMINGYGNDLKCLSYREGNIFIQEKKNFFS